MADASVGALLADAADPDAADLSVRLLDAVFGTGWANLASALGGDGTGGVMGTLVFELMYVLNCCGACAVAWLFLLTTLSATLGAAQDGTGFGGRRYSNAWIPMRLSFAMGAVTPVFHGLSAMQVLVLSALSVSVSFANAMWETGLEHISRSGCLTAIASPQVQTTARGVVAGLVRHASLRRYLEENGGCTFSPSPRDLTAGPVGRDWRVTFELPWPETCRPIGSIAQLPATRPADMGSVTVSTASREASEALAAFLREDLYPRVLSLVTASSLAGGNAGDGAPTPARALEVRALAARYAAATAGILSKASATGDASEGEEGGVASPKARALGQFRDHAATQGWMSAGGYYWALARLAAQSVEMQRDETRVADPDLEALRAFANPTSEAWLRNGWALADAAANAVQERGPVLHPVTGALLARSAEPEADEGSFWGSVAGFLAPAAQAVAEFRLTDQTEAAGALLSLLGGNDIVFNVVRASRRVMGACEDAAAAYVALRIASRTAEALAGWVPFAGDRLARTASAISDAVTFAATAALAIAAPLWAICWFYAFMVPAIPFIAWFTAVLGWLVLSLEAVAACPVWLIAHAMPEGDGFAGVSGRAGWALFMSVLLRPMLLVLAFFLCMIVMSVSGELMGVLLIPFFSASSGAFLEEGAGFASGFGVAEAVSAVILVGTVTGIATWKLFTLVTVMPDRILRWAGQLFQHLGDDNARNEVKAGVDAMTGAGARTPGALATVGTVAAAGSLMAGRAALKRMGGDSAALAGDAAHASGTVSAASMPASTDAASDATEARHAQGVRRPRAVSADIRMDDSAPRAELVNPILGYQRARNGLTDLSDASPGHDAGRRGGLAQAGGTHPHLPHATGAQTQAPSASPEEDVRADLHAQGTRRTR